MKVLIIDDSKLWIEQGMKVLNPDLYEVKGYQITDPQRFEGPLGIPNPQHELKELMHWTDAILIDKDLGQGVNSTRLICVIRHMFPKLPIVRWTGGFEATQNMKLLRVSTIAKPSRKSEDTFSDTFSKALREQFALHKDPMDLIDILWEKKPQNEHRSRERERRIKQLSQIARLAHKESVLSDNWQHPWEINGRNGDIMKHELGHCICDGYLTAEDIRPHLANLQKVIEKLEEADEIDKRFRLCAEFIKEGNLEQLELFRHCY